jgi:folate-dependent phosphoribosylglycinamide formyltransferase PurN
MSKIKAIILATDGMTTNMLFHGLSAELDIVKVYIEGKPSKKQLFKRRVKRIGWMKSLGQLFFLLVVRPFIPAKKKRIQQILKMHELPDHSIPDDRILRVSNMHEVTHIHELAPDLVIINGTRILKQDFLAAIPCPIVNIHVGITPKYRGVHGGYWALRNGEPELFGVTLHLVDAGIDTGKVIAQKVCTPSKEDNFKTYPVLQYAEGIHLLKTHAENIAKSEIVLTTPLTEESQLWYHPTIWEYLF